MEQVCASPDPGDDSVGLAQRLSLMIQVPTVGEGPEQSAMAPFEEFLGLLRRLYPLTFEELQSEQITDLGLLMRWQGRGSADPLVLMAHYDVVPAAASDGWRYPPFSGHVQDGWVHGRGALDDKGPLLVILEAVETLLEEGFVPSRDVYLSFGGNEETYGDAAAQIARALKNRGIAPWLVLDEGGAVVQPPLPMVTGETAMIGIGEKGVATIRLTADSSGGHASAPDGPTAVAHVAEAVAALDASVFPARSSTAVQAMLQALSTRAAGTSGKLLQLLAKTPGVTAKVFARMGPEPAAMVRTTVAATRISGGSADNVLPPSAEAVLNLRLHPAETVQSALRRVRRRIRNRPVRAELITGSDPSPHSPVNGAQFAALSQAVEDSYPGALPTPYLMMQASDSRHFHRFFPAVYRFAPLRMTAQQRASIHGVNECVSIDSLGRGVRFHLHLMRHL